MSAFWTRGQTSVIGIAISWLPAEMMDSSNRLNYTPENWRIGVAWIILHIISLCGFIPALWREKACSEFYISRKISFLQLGKDLLMRLKGVNSWILHSTWKMHQANGINRGAKWWDRSQEDCREKPTTLTEIKMLNGPCGSSTWSKYFLDVSKVLWDKELLIQSLLWQHWFVASGLCRLGWGAIKLLWYPSLQGRQRWGLTFCCHWQISETAKHDCKNNFLNLK